jgi:protein-disulfide isomerase
VKRLLLPTALLLATLPLLAADQTPSNEPPAPPQNAKAEKFITASLPICSEEMTIKRIGMQHKLPDNLVGTVIRTDSKRGICQGQWLSVVSTQGGHYFGMPWFLDAQAKLPTIEEKLKDFLWTAMRTNFDIQVTRSHTRDGLYKVTLNQLFEGGKVPMEGEVDPEGKVFFLGHFTPLDSSPADLLKPFAPHMAKAPTEGGAAAKVTVVEFSDFECPSCKNASGYLDPILKQYGADVKYVRYDTPLMMMHPWALSAAVAGRAIYKQKPEAFWAYKKQVYENQDKLSAFTIDEFARHFVQDHELDLKKYDADVASAEVRGEILNGVGAAFANNVMSTPTYMVNGRFVDPGNEGKALAAYVGTLVGK